MMRKISVFVPVLFLTSCHVNDIRPENHRADVSIVKGNICVALPDSEGESLSLISINEIWNDKNMLEKTFPIESLPALYPNKCISNFGFTFNSGKSYVFSIHTIKLKKDRTMKNGNSYSVTFSVWEDKNGLKMKDIN